MGCIKGRTVYTLGCAAYICHFEGLSTGVALGSAVGSVTGSGVASGGEDGNLKLRVWRRAKTPWTWGGGSH